MKSIADPACGTGGFFLGAYNWLTRPGARLNKSEKEFLRDKTFHGNEIVPNTRRMCQMNLFLHSIGELDGEPLVERSDALITEPKRKVDYILANPPFGKKSSMTFTNGEGEEDKGALTYGAARLLGNHVEQATQLPAAHRQHVEVDWQSCRGVARQRAVRRRRGRKKSAASCSKTAMCTPCCACPLAFFTRRG